MRPRVFPAEDSSSARGRNPQPVASMRPRVFPAEDYGPRSRPWRPLSGFNEAAGIPRGRPTTCRGPAATRSSFNEAAGIPRGRRRAGPRVRRRGDAASMRPRVFPAEDQDGADRGVGAVEASMRPRVFPAEDWAERGEPPRATRASMRPRVFPAEDPPRHGCRMRQCAASMRPRVFPAEDMDGLWSRTGRRVLQ